MSDTRQTCCHWGPVGDDSEPDPEGAVRLHDHFSATVELRIAEIQPQYGLVQLNATRRACGALVSCDVNRDEFLAAVASVLNVTFFDKALLAHEGAVEKVAEALYVLCADPPEWRDDYPKFARAVLDMITGLIGGDDD